MEISEIVEKYKKETNCFTCIHRGTVCGSAHSSCKVFDDKEAIKSATILNAMKASMFQHTTNFSGLVLTFEGRDEQIPVQDWYEHGIRNGWALFPLNFDPVWLKYCLFYSKLENE